MVDNIKLYRYFLRLDYNGANYHGWQIQPNAKTVQGEINFALSKLLSEDINIVGCGRTDTGVHAKNFIAHFDSKNNQLHLNDQLLFKLNRFLKHDIVIHSITIMHNDAHSRFDATARTYHYFINHKKDPFNTNFQWLISYPLNVNAMNQAAQILLAHTDFTSFSKVDTDTKTNNCLITQAIWEICGSKLTFTITADRFLRNMVRAIVGTLVEIGRDKLTIDEFEKVIKAKNRSEAGASAPGNALFLTNVAYPYPIK